MRSKENTRTQGLPVDLAVENEKFRKGHFLIEVEIDLFQGGTHVNPSHSFTCFFQENVGPNLLQCTTQKQEYERNRCGVAM